MTGRTHVDVERCVRNRLYGERSDVTAARVARTAVPARAPAQLLGGRYRLLGLIGAGGMTNVYCTRDELLKRRVAVKILAEPLASDPRFLREFRREAELWGGARAPVHRRGLRRRRSPAPVHRDGARTGSERQGARAATEPADVRPGDPDRRAGRGGARLAHEHNVIPRDVSLGNILIRRSDGAAMLTHFGLALQSRREGPEIRRRRRGDVRLHCA
ncbi:MAG: hypothetical protein M3550_12330 [Actinomycetota bacterium]|nr:hypothetical protein [Actinomycetota bacterium]